MPTNVSRPNWACEICRTTFGEDRAAAERCESAGQPAVLPDGDLALVHDYRYGRPAYRLVGLHPLTVPGTRARRYNGDTGHLARYELEPSGGDRPQVVTAEWLWPHMPGCLEVMGDGSGRPGSGRGHDRRHGRGSAGLALWALDRTGLAGAAGRGELARSGLDGPRLVGPVTAAVRAVFDMLRAEILPVRDDWYGKRGVLAALAAEATGARDQMRAGVYDANRCAWWLAQTADDGLLAGVAKRHRQWLEGEPVVVPRPRLRSALRVRGYKLSASKLTKEQRATVAAVGVEWPPRTTADEYLALVLSSLEVKMTEVAEARGQHDAAYFGDAEIVVAVQSGKGGVGKSTTAGAVGYGLAARGHHVALIDLNLPNPGQHSVWRLGPLMASRETKLIVPQVVAEPAGRLAVFSHGQLARPGEPMGGVIDVSQAGAWLKFLAGTLDLRGVTAVVLDLPPGWDAVHSCVFAEHLVALTACVHVTTGHPLALESETLAGPERGSKVRRLLVENMSRARGVVTDGTGRTEEIRLYGTGDDAVRQLAEREGAEYIGSLPWEPDPARLADAPAIAALVSALESSGRGAR